MASKGEFVAVPAQGGSNAERTLDSNPSAVADHLGQSRISRAGQNNGTVYDARLDVPPSYSTIPDAPPPAYDSIFGKIKEIKKESEEKVGSCGDKTCKTCVTVLFRTFAFILFIGIPLAMLTMGVLYLTRCPVSKMIPIYLIVAGSTAAFYFLTLVFRKIVKKIQKNREKTHTSTTAAAVAGEATSDETKKSEPVYLRIFDTVMSIFIFAWFIAGNYYVYKVWHTRPCDIYDCSEESFCNPHLLLFSFWLITSTYIMCGCCTCTGICIGCIGICAGIGDDK